MFLRDTRLQNLTHLELACARISEGCFGDLLSFWHHHTGSLENLTLKSLKLSRKSRHVAAQNSWPATPEEMGRLPFKLSFLSIQSLYGADLDPIKQVVVFSEKPGPWERDECQRSL